MPKWVQNIIWACLGLVVASFTLWLCIALMTLAFESLK